MCDFFILMVIPIYILNDYIRFNLFWLIVLGFNDTSTLEGHFVSSPREREKRDRRESRGDEREGQGRKRNRKESEETEEIKTFPLSSALSSAGYFKSHCCKQCGPRSDCTFRSSLIWVHTVCLYAKCKFEKFARRCSRGHKQTTFSDADFLGALKVNSLIILSRAKLIMRNIPSDACAQQRLKSACASAVWSESVVQMKKFASVAIQNCPVKILIRLYKCTGWSESSLGAHVRKYFFLSCGSKLTKSL